MTDLWPPDFGNLGVTPPVVTLKEQAAIITNKTKGSIEGRVASGKNGKEFYHDFFLVAPFLDDYTYRLFAVVHPIGFYPLEIVADVLDKRLECNSPEELVNQLRAILNADETKKVVASLLEQTEAVKA